MATFQAKSYREALLKEYEDPETGCSSRDEVAFQSCREAYFLKQQNQILQNQQPSTKKEKENGEILGTTTQAQVKEANNYATVGSLANGISPPLLYALTIAATVIVTVVVTKYLTKKKSN